MNRSRKLALAGMVLATVAVAATALIGASVGSAKRSDSPYKVAWILVGPHNDGGWSQAHYDGMKYVKKELGSKVQVTYKENIAVGTQFSQTVASLVAQGYKLIFATSYGYVTPAIAAKYPDVLFEQATGTYQAKNVAEYFGAAEDTIYPLRDGGGRRQQDGQDRLRRRLPDPRGDPPHGRLCARGAGHPSGGDGVDHLDELVVRAND